MSGSGLRKQFLLGFCFSFKAKKSYFKSYSWHQCWCHEESLQSLESEKNYDTQFCSEFSLKSLMKEKGGRESDTKDFSNNLFWFILKFVCFIKLLACERRRKEFFLLFVGVTRSFLSIFQVQNYLKILCFLCLIHWIFLFSDIFHWLLCTHIPTFLNKW